MPKDERMYMTFPNDIHRHPKIERLPVAARWAFIEMNGEARIADNDGRFAAEDAEFLWSQEALTALLKSHPSRPLLIRDGTDYVIREYAKHQQTKADREALSAKRAEAGRKGGLAKAQASASKSQADSGKQKQSQSQSHQTSTYVNESQSLDNRARNDDELSTTQQGMAARAGLEVDRLRQKVFDQLGIRLTLTSTLTVGLWLLDKPKKAPDYPTRYVIGCVTRSPAEVEQYIHEAGLK